MPARQQLEWSPSTCSVSRRPPRESFSISVSDCSASMSARDFVARHHSTGLQPVRSDSEVLVRSRARNTNLRPVAFPPVYDQSAYPCAERRSQQNARPIVECLPGANTTVAAQLEI